MSGRGKIIVSFVLALMTVGSLVAAVYFYTQVREIKNNPQKLVQKVAEEDITKTVSKVGQLMFLPDNETPTVATVVNPDALKNQLFFANAKVGDKLLIYNVAKKAILYDPVANKIVEVAPLNIGNANK